MERFRTEACAVKMKGVRTREKSEATETKSIAAGGRIKAHRTVSLKYTSADQ